MSDLVHDLIFHTARRTPAAEALVYGPHRLTYAALADAVTHAAGALLACGVKRRERVAVYLEKRVENVVAMFGAACAGAVFVPVNPLLKPEQLAYILADCDVRLLVTSPERLALLGAALAHCPALRTIIVTGAGDSAGNNPGLAAPDGVALVGWEPALAVAAAAHALPAVNTIAAIDADMAAIL